MTNRCADNVVFVQCILPHREYLFSKFSPKITHEGKKRRWLYIRDQLVASGMAHFVGKDDSYMRQKWADMKRRTIEKLSRMGQNSRANLSEVDALIFRIIGGKEAIDQRVVTPENSGLMESNNLSGAHYETTADNDNERHLLLSDQQQQNLKQNSPNLTAATKSEPNITVCTLPLLQQQQQQATAQQIVPTSQQATAQQIVPTSSASVPMFHPTVTHNGISLTTTLRRKRKRIKKRGDRMPKICGMNCQNEKIPDQQQQMESDDLEEQVKRAKLAYYKSQIDLNYSLKSESVLRKRLLTLQIEQIQQEIEGDDDDEQ